MTLGRSWLIAAGFICALGLAGTLPSVAQSLFSDEQKQEMHEVIRDYLINNPEVLREAFEALERKERMAQQDQAREKIKMHADLLYRSERGFVYGNPNGDVTMVEFFDYNCGYCKRSLSDVLALVDSDPELKLVLKEFPILGSGSVFASRAAIASKKQGKYWDFHIAMMSNRGAVDEAQVLAIAQKVGLDMEKLKADMEDPDVTATISESMQLAEAVGINGTPAFVIDDALIPGALGIDGLRAQIAEVREGGGCAVC